MKHSKVKGSKYRHSLILDIDISTQQKYDVLMNGYMLKMILKLKISMFECTTVERTFDGMRQSSVSCYILIMHSYIMVLNI